jgi:hypothetical protein
MSWSFPKKPGGNGESLIQHFRISSRKSSLHVWSILTFLPIDSEGWETPTKSSFAVLDTGWSIA